MAQGGIRPGAGRPRNDSKTLQTQLAEAQEVLVEQLREATGALESSADQSPLDFMLAVMRDVRQPMQMRMNAAVNCAPYVHVKKGEAGKKEAAGEKATATAKGTFKPNAAPPLKRVA